MDDIGKFILSLFSGVITLAIVSVIISKKSNAPNVLQDASTLLSKTVSAAVSPVTTAATNGNLGNNTFTTPQLNLPGVTQDTLSGPMTNQALYGQPIG